MPLRGVVRVKTSGLIDNINILMEPMAAVIGSETPLTGGAESCAYDGPLVLGDWGTSRLRLFLVNGKRVLDRLEGSGTGALTEPPAAALARILVEWRGRHGVRRVVLCGMAGSRNGLAETPYAPCPVDRSGWSAAATDLAVGGLTIGIAAGVECRTASGAADVMRGEETQIFGAIAANPVLAKGRHVIVLPGTHSKWAMIEGGSITHFQTYFTGELFALLRDHSTLTSAGEDDSDFDEGFATGLTRGPATGLTAALFEARSAQLVDGRTRGWGIGLLSGLLIGQELADALARFGDPRAVTIIGDPSLAALYSRAFARHEVALAEVDGDAASLAGLMALNATLELEPQ